MSTDSRSDSPVVRFLDSFLDEKNIKWVLCSGLLILLGSSLMMVTRSWDTFNPTLKFSIVLAYTATVFGAGQWSYHKLALRKTGTALLALTVLLLPVSFVAWQFLWEEAATHLTRVVAIGLLVANTAVAAFASRRTFHHFLQGHQTTFLISYLLLGLAAAVAPIIASTGTLASCVASIVLWAIFAVGATKVNRHVFWLTEEHRKPRIFGFFPIVLLGSQFLLIFATNFAAAIDRAWLGLGCVLVAIPVLFTADTVARVFQQRTGNVVRPIPWPIILPLVVGLALCASGIGIAASGLASGNSYALVPTAAATAIVLGVAARRTDKRAFAWAMLGSIVLAYNFSPVFFADTARAVLATSAEALNESKLPYAFYGLTYLPLILGMTGAAVALRKRNAELFVKPHRQCAIGLSVILLLAATGHPKALLPVAGVMTTVFALQSKLFRDRRLALAGTIAFLIASLGVVPFAAALGFELPDQMLYVVPGIAAAMLLLASPELDRRIAAIATSEQRTESPLWQTVLRTTSLVATLGLAAAWLTRWQMGTDATEILASCIIGGLLIIHSLVWTRSWLSWTVYLLFVGEFLRSGVTEGIAPHTLAAIATLILGGQWVISYLLERYPTSRVSLAWANVNQTSAFIGLLIATLGYALPDMAKELIPWIRFDVVPWWTRDVLLVAWCFDAARRPRRIFNHNSKAITWERHAQPIPATLGCLCVLGLVGCALIRIGGEEMASWLPVAWTLTAVAALPITQRLQRRTTLLAELPGRARDHAAARAIAAPVDVTTCSVFVVFAALQLILYTTPLRVAGYIALAGLVVLTVLRRQPLLKTATLALFNWTVLVNTMALFVPSADHAMELLAGDFSPALFIMAAIASVSVLLWQLPEWHAADPARDLALVQRCFMRFIGLGALLLAAQEPSLSVFNLGLSGLAFASLIAAELRSAVRLRDELRVWTAESIAAAAIGYLCWFEVITFERGIAMFVALGGGVMMHVLGLLASRSDRASVFARPFLITGRWMPLATVGIGIFRHVAYDTQWLGLTSLAVLLAGGFYFWQAIERKSKGFAVLSAAILNTSLMLLWSELGTTMALFRDPQFYMIPVGISVLVLVEVLKREIPKQWHDPLRYAGALTILVSPTFNILGAEHWWHMLSLMVASTLVLLASIGLRIRALMYAGAAFLVADLVGMVIRGGLENHNVLWIVGIGFGAAVVMLGAYCEHNREKLLQRMRIVSAQLQQWN